MDSDPLGSQFLNDLADAVGGARVDGNGLIGLSTSGILGLELTAHGTPAFVTTVPATSALGQMTQEQFATMRSELNTYRGRLADDATFRPVECKFAVAGLTFSPATLAPIAVTVRLIRWRRR